MMIEVSDAVKFLAEKDNYLILMHGNPDGDTLGCGFALCIALQRMGKNAKAVCPDHIPAKFDYLREGVLEQEFEYENIVCVDIADSKLLGDMKELGDKAELCIDHHISNMDYAKRTLLRAEYAANSELVYEVINALGVKIDREIANCLYTGISTDTGCFKFSNTSPQTHRYAAELMELGAEYARINYLHFDLKTKGRLALEQHIYKGMKFFEGGKIALICITLDDMSRLVNVDSDDVSSMASIPRQIEGVEIGISFKEKKGGVFKASLRSSEKINVAEIAQGFGGGGHDRAAGCSFECGYEEAEKRLIEACSAALKKAGLV